MVDILQVIREWEWLLLTLVAILEVTILYISFKEKREREKLIHEMEVTREELGREKYIIMIKETIKNSSQYIYFISHSLTSNLGEKQKDEIYQLYKKGIDHRCITGKDPGKIKYMWEQRRNNVEIRVNEFILMSTFRYQVCDDKFAVLGFADEGDEESRKGILIKNLYFCRQQKQNFLKLWDESEIFENYIKEVISKISPDLSYTVEDFSKEWNLNDIEKQELSMIISTI